MACDMNKFTHLNRIILRVLWVALFLVGAAWILSYFIYFESYRSTWTERDDEYREDARWVWSNFGSVGFGIRRQSFASEDQSLPDDQNRSDKQRAAIYHLKNIHEPTVFAWHWTKYSRQKELKPGTGRPHRLYQDLFIPYWMIFLGLILIMTPLIPGKEGGTETTHRTQS